MSPDIQFNLEDVEVKIDLTDWFTNAKGVAFDGRPREVKISYCGLQIVVGLPSLQDLYDYQIWLAKNTNMSDTSIERQIDKDLTSTGYFVRRIEAVDGSTASGLENMIHFVENLEHNVYEEVRDLIVHLNDSFQIPLHNSLGADGSPLILTPVNCLDVSQIPFP